MARYRGGLGRVVTVELADPRPPGENWDEPVRAWLERRKQAWATAAHAAGAGEMTVMRLLVEHPPGTLRCHELPGGGVWISGYDLAELRQFEFADENGNRVVLL